MSIQKFQCNLKFRMETYAPRFYFSWKRLELNRGHFVFLVFYQASETLAQPSCIKINVSNSTGQHAHSVSRVKVLID